jgi:hypothetical protein
MMLVWDTHICGRGVVQSVEVDRKIYGVFLQILFFRSIISLWIIFRTIKCTNFFFSKKQLAYLLARKRYCLNKYVNPNNIFLFWCLFQNIYVHSFFFTFFLWFPFKYMLHTGKSFSDLASTDLQYGKRFFIELQAQYIEIACCVNKLFWMSQFVYSVLSIKRTGSLNYFEVFLPPWTH